MAAPSFALTDAEGRALTGWRIVDGPWDVGSEERWLLELADGQRAMLCRLSPELARDESLRRRWVRDVERMRSCEVASVAPTLAWGPQPDPRDPGAEPPWRLRVEPAGEALSRWLERAPVPLGELAQRGAALADALHAVHLAGAVARSLHPRDLVWTAEGRVVLRDVGLARVDLLSSHTASSLVLGASPYAAPEQLLRTVVDQRADLYSLGVILWQATTGELPFGDGPALLALEGRGPETLPSLASLRRDAPPVLELLLRRCLAARPGERVASAAEIAWVLRGGAGDGLVEHEQTVCQHCGAALRLGQRLCLECGRLGVRYGHLEAGARSPFGVELRSLSEDAGKQAALREFIVSVADTPRGVGEFATGDVTMYAEHELSQRKRLPARLFDDLDGDTAEQLCAQLRERGLDVRVVRPHRGRRWALGAVLSLVFTASLTALLVALNVGPAAIAFLVVAGIAATLGAAGRASSAVAERRLRPLYRLRRQPAALPASDPLVARLAALLNDSPGGPTPADVRAQLGELALLVQRLVDRRAELTGLVEAEELELLTAPVAPLIAELERRVAELARLDAELSELDEGAMVRALATLEARRGLDEGQREHERRRLLEGLDRLRSREDRRIAGFHRLLEASTLLRRAVDLGLEVHDGAREQERRVALAVASLSSG